MSNAAAEAKTTLAKSARDQSMLWGSSIEFWDLWGVRLLFVGAIVGVGGLVLSAFSAYVLYRVADVAQKELVIETRTSAELVAKLNNDTARLTADNLALQTVMSPRSVGAIGFNEPPKAQTWFAGMEAFAGVEVTIQSVEEGEAQNLANEIAIVLAHFGVASVRVDRMRTQIFPAYIPDGVSVSYPTGKAWTEKEPNQPWFAWAKAAEALANALTKAGLGVGDKPVSRFGFMNERPQIPGTSPFFNPPLEGVLLLVGARPIASTIAWIKQGRPDVLGNKPADTAPTEPHK